MTSRRSGLVVGPPLDERQLQSRAAGLKVVGLPADLWRLVRDLDGASAVDILQRFYLPNVLGYAYLHKGLAAGLLLRERDGKIRVASPLSPLALSLPEDVRAELAGMASGDMVLLPRRPALALLRQRGEVTAQTRVLCLAERDGLAPCLAAAGAARVVVIDDDERLFSCYRRHGVHCITADLRLLAGFPFAAFDLVTGCQLGSDLDDYLLDTMITNLAPYGTLLTCVAAGSQERMAVIAALSSLENVAVITDMREHCGLFVFRATKVPELRGNPAFLRYYVD